MNIYKYASSKDIDKTYNYKILVYPNITYMKDLEKDSYVVVLANVIREMNKVRDDIHWTILSPMKSAKDEIKSLRFHNTLQLPIEFPSYPNAMRTHFDYNNFMKALDWKNNEYDIVYSHLPEHTNLLANAIYNNTNMRPKFIGGYCHWFEVDENTAYSERLFIENISGILKMQECGVNSIWLKNLVIEKSKELFSDKVIKKLEDIIQPHYLGIDEISTGHNYKPKTILFNHRDNEYTGWSWFVKRMDELWEQRQDFKVYLTLADLNRPYAERVKIHSRDDYLNFVRSMHMGVGCFQKYSAWSISTTDGLSQGVPYILPNGMCYPEMVGEQYPLLYKSNNAQSFKDTIENMLDNSYVRDEANFYLEPNLNDFKWSERVPKWFNNWKFLDDLEIIGDKSEAYPKIVEFIKKKKFVTKREITDYLNWGVRISLTAYRNKLREEKNIRFTRDGYEYIGA
jgi:hypothetical protein